MEETVSKGLSLSISAMTFGAVALGGLIAGGIGYYIAKGNGNGNGDSSQILEMRRELDALKKGVENNTESVANLGEKVESVAEQATKADSFIMHMGRRVDEMESTVNVLKATSTKQSYTIKMIYKCLDSIVATDNAYIGKIGKLVASLFTGS